MKKVLLFLLLIIFPFITYALPVGDVDGNGKVNTNDYLLIRKHLLKIPELTGNEKIRADVNSDGVVSQKDYILIRKIQLGLITVTPIPTITIKPTTAPTTKSTVKPTATSTIKPITSFQIPLSKSDGSLLIAGDPFVTYDKFRKCYYYLATSGNSDFDLKSSVNAGKSGWYISNKNSKWIVDRVKSYKNNSYNYVIMEGGTNDIGDGILIGTYSSNDFSGNYNINNFLGGLETYIYTVKKQWPNAKISYIILYQTPNAANKNRKTKSLEYFREMKKVLNKWGVSYIDLYEGKASNGQSYSDLLKVSTKTYLWDGLHLNVNGNAKLAPYIYEWMNKL